MAYIALNDYRRKLGRSDLLRRILVRLLAVTVRALPDRKASLHGASLLTIPCIAFDVAKFLGVLSKFLAKLFAAAVKT